MNRANKNLNQIGKQGLALKVPWSPHKNSKVEDLNSQDARVDPRRPFILKMNWADKKPKLTKKQGINSKMILEG